MPYFEPTPQNVTFSYWLVYALIYAMFVAVTFVVLCIVGWLVIKAMDVVTVFTKRPPLAFVAPIVGVIVTLGLVVFVNYRILCLDNFSPLVLAGGLWFISTWRGLKVALYGLTHLDAIRATLSAEVEERR
jgi:hypothetical protein